jgi:gliding motility-associated-like protein
MKKLLLLIGLSLLVSIQLKAQFPLTNPSFEGSTGSGYVPAPWNMCGNTPDTQTPGASQGNNYLGIGVTALGGGVYEGVSQLLSCPLKSGSSYTFAMDLRATDTSGVAFPSSGTIEVWGGNTSCDLKELLWTSPILTHYNWQNYTVTFTPNASYTFIIIKATCNNCVNNPFGEHSSYMNVDNITSAVYACGLSASLDSLVVCKNKCATLKPVVSGGTKPYTFKWDNGLAADSIASICPALESKTYTVTVTDAGGLTKTASAVLTVDASPLCGKTLNCVNDSCDKPYGPYFYNNGTTITLQAAKDSGFCYLIDQKNLAPRRLCFAFVYPAGYDRLQLFCSYENCNGTTNGLSVQYNVASNGSVSNGSNSNATGNTSINTSCTNNCCKTDLSMNLSTGGGLKSDNTYLYPNCTKFSDKLVIGPTCGMVVGQTYVHCIDLKTPATNCEKLYICPIFSCAGGGCNPGKICLPIENFTSSVPAKCYGENNGIASVSTCPGNKYTYLWSTGDTTPSVSGLKAGIYKVTIKDSISCDTSVSVVVTQPAPFKVNAGTDKELCEGKDTLLGGFPTGPVGSVYSWGPLAGLNNPSSPNPSVTAGAESEMYIVRVTDSIGCVNYDSVYVKVKKCGISIPNVFTPVGNGVNDLFVIRGLEQFPNSRLHIYNRWGTLVYESNNYLNDWDGRQYKTLNRLNEGVYYYILELPDGSSPHGFVTLIRGYKF